MNYQDAANFLFDLRRFGQQAGTESASDLLEYLGRPEEELAAVQIAGSNGKGSTARMTESVLREAGLTVGLFTSPHLDDLRERIRVDGRKIPKSALSEFVEEIRTYVRERGADGLSPTFFEATTVLAQWHFARQGVDVAVLEVGIGGKLDATSVVDPIASAVTTVTLEHTGILGDTIQEIARDKAHVAPDDRPLVTGATGDALEAIRAVTGDVITVGAVADTTRDGDGDGVSSQAASSADVSPTYNGRTNHTEAAIEIDATGDDTVAGSNVLDWHVDARVPTIGAYQAENAAIAAVLARQVTGALGDPVEPETIASGLRQSHWPGRFEVIGRSPLTVLDGAHNPDACRRLSNALAEFDDEYDDLHLVFGAMHDKAHTEMAAALPTPTTVTTCRPDVSRAADQEVLTRVFERAGVDAVTACEAVADAVERALDRAGQDDAVLVTGSLYGIGEARRRWRRLQIPKRIESSDDARDVLGSAHVTESEARQRHECGVHRVVKTRVQKRQALRLREELLGLGGECVISGLAEHGDAAVDVVLMGTLAQFRTLVETLEEQPFGLARLASDLRTILAIDGGSDSGYDPEATLPWTDSPATMGILNVTPDSFHDGGEYDRVEDAVARAQEMAEAGASIVDIGGESTRPGADPVSVDEEIDRVVPVIKQLDDLDAAVSVDTRKAPVAEAALEAGADIVNDVSGLADPEMRFVAADHDAALVVMHSIETPVEPDVEPTYDDVVEDVIDQLTERVLLAEKAGIDRERIIVDPGLGFGKSARESFELLSRLDELRALGCPIMVGHSHKSMFDLAGYEHGERHAPTIAATALAAERGADVLRVHDVPENVAATRVVEAADSLPD
jgi:dihydropteroate synthase